MVESEHKVHVSLGDRSYDIRIGSGVLPQVGRLLHAMPGVTHAVVITDRNVLDRYAQPAAASLAEASLRTAVVDVEPGEESKSVAVAEALWHRLLDLGADRKSVVVAVGGGVVGDLAGFVAATFARGLRFFQVPTTLLAQVDSSVGGKVGINLPQAKNMVGAFLQPLGVLIDIAALETLEPRQYRAGLGEVVKYGVILDPALFAFLEDHVAELLQRDHPVLTHVVARCCQLKAEVVQQDEREETGLRAILNYGHTVAHALETAEGYGTLLHGEAVSIGMVCAAQLAKRLGRVDATFSDRQRRLLDALGLPTRLPAADPDALLAIMTHDKKAQHGQLRFVLPSRLGHVDLVGGVDIALVREVLRGW